MTTEPAAVAETHSAVLFFHGDHVVKVKKAVDLGFLDFSTLDKRLCACRREVELNRRMAPDVYLGVVDIVGPDGRPCEHGVLMRRMPADRRLSTLVTEGVDVDDALRQIARTVAEFHAVAPRSPAFDVVATPAVVLGRWERNAELMSRTGVLPAEQVAAVLALAHRFIDGRHRLFEDRIAGRWIRDGHGDLLADDIFCLDDGPRILDCLDFDDALRCGDVISDAAFLAMDLARLGRPDLGDRFLALWAEMLGGDHPRALIDHYLAYRAEVRAEVSCIRAAQGDATAARAAAGLLHQCLGALDRCRVRLVLVGGLPGTGKSSLAAALAGRLGATLLRSDLIRKELAGVDPSQSAAAAFKAGLYDDGWTGRTYAELLRRAELALGVGETVVIDASWTDQRQRDAASATAAAALADLVELQCEVDRTTAAARIEARMAAGGDPSDADVGIATAMAAEADPWPTAASIDTSAGVDAVLENALEVVGRAPAVRVP